MGTMEGRARKGERKVRNKTEDIFKKPITLPQL